MNLSPVSSLEALIQSPLCKLYDELRGTLFWVKAKNLTIIHVNGAFANWVNKPLDSIIGKTDHDLYFDDLAQTFSDDDKRVMQTRTPIQHKAELVANRFGGVDWRYASKFPIINEANKVIGTCGISQEIRQEQAAEIPDRYKLVSSIVDYLRSNCHESITVSQLAKRFHMSVSSLERYFQSHLGKTPKAFSDELRIARARQLLCDTQLTASEIGLSVGYSDLACFSRAFKRHMGQSPQAYRDSTPPPHRA